MKKLIFILFLFSLYLYSQTADKNKNTVSEKLIYYVNEGNVKEVENILKQHNDYVNNRNYEGFTLLSLAVMDNNIEMAELLLKYKADVNANVDLGDSLLIGAVDNKNMEMVKLLLSYGADIDYQGFRGRTALFSSLNKGGENKENIEMVKLLIKNKADDIANILLQNGSDSLDKSLKVCNLNKETLLSYDVPLITAAVYSTNEVFLQKLIDNGANVNYKNYDEKTALIEAASYNNINAVKVLIKNNADLNVQNKQGKTALMWACHSGNLEMTKMLLDAGADKSIKRGNYDALYYAREYGKNEEIIKLLTQ